MERTAQMKKYEVELCRVHKSSPYNCSGYIPEIRCVNDDDVINLPEVQKMINQSYGKRFVVHIHPENCAYDLQYNITKKRAIL